MPPEARIAVASDAAAGPASATEVFFLSEGVAAGTTIMDRFPSRCFVSSNRLSRSCNRFASSRRLSRSCRTGRETRRGHDERHDVTWAKCIGLSVFLCVCALAIGKQTTYVCVCVFVCLCLVCVCVLCVSARHAAAFLCLFRFVLVLVLVLFSLL